MGSSVNIQSAATESIKLIICDISGKILWDQNSTINQGNNIVALPYSILPKGMFLLRIKGTTIDEGLMIQK
jgi:hypothetical protein